MRRLATAAAVAILGLAALTPPAAAQVVIGTRPVYAPGTVVSPYGVVNPNANRTVAGAIPMTGYYSPYPGYMYSPYANNAGNYYGYGYGYGYDPYSSYYGGYGYPYGAYTYHQRFYTNPPGGVLHANPLYGHPLGTHYYR